jgi:hypothetical protein
VIGVRGVLHVRHEKMAESSMSTAGRDISTIFELIYILYPFSLQGRYSLVDGSFAIFHRAYPEESQRKPAGYTALRIEKEGGRVFGQDYVIFALMSP